MTTARVAIQGALTPPEDTNKMQTAWIIDVLEDLRDFARQNSLASTADHLDDTILMAACDVAARHSLLQGGQGYNASTSGGPRSTFATSDNA